MSAGTTKLTHVRALIVDEGRERSSVAAARALASAGWLVGAGAAHPNLASHCRAVDRWHHVAHTNDGEDAFLTTLSEAINAGGFEAVFVTWERAVALVSERREELPCAVGYGPHPGVMTAMDKGALGLIAAACEIPPPRTFTAATLEQESPKGRLVVKPALQTVLSRQAQVFDDPAGALACAIQIESAGSAAVIQEHLEGALVAMSFVAGPQGIVSVSQQVAEKVWPQPVGVTARGLTVRVDPQLRRHVDELIARLEWQGLAQLQFIVPADGMPRLIDFNPRLYGSLALAIRAGANHPDVWGRLMIGAEVTPCEGRAGARFQWFSRDLRASLASEHRVTEMADCLIVGVSATHSLWSFSEPTLAAGFLTAQAARAVRRRLSRVNSQELDANAALYGVPATPAIRRALRARRIPPFPLRAAQRVLMKTGRLSYEENWLKPLQAAREKAIGERARGAPRFLVRVDEFPDYSGFDNQKFGVEASRRFHAVMAEAQVPHLMSVVPQWTHEPLTPGSSGGRSLDSDDRDLLEQMSRDGVTFAQHGCTHRTLKADTRHQSELCGLDARALEDLLKAGQSKLAEVGITPRILVPPFNRFDASQWPVLSRMYDVITGGPESVVYMGFQGGPQWRGEAIYLPCYAPLYGTAAEVIQAVEKLIASEVATWIPVVLHMGWEIDDSYAALGRLAARIAPYAVSWDRFLDEATASRRARTAA